MNDESRTESDFNERRGGENRPATVDDIILGDLVANASRSGAKLKELLGGTILIKLVDSGKRFLIDWTGTELKAQSVGKDSVAECTILVSEDHLKRISYGDLNPQIAMLSEKIRVEGRKSVAMYFFNLIAPRSVI